MKQKTSWLTKDIACFSLASFFNDCCHEMTTAILPTFMQQITGVQASFYLGLVTGISSTVSSIVQLWSGWLSDRIHHHKILLVIGYATTPLFVSMIGLARNVYQVVFLRTIAWIGRGLREPPRDAWMASIIRPEHYGKAFGFQRAFDTLGALAGPLIAYFLLFVLPLKAIFLVSFLPGILSVFFILFLSHEEVIQKIRDKQISFLQQLNGLPRSFVGFILARIIFSLGFFDKTLIVLRFQELFTSMTVTSVVATGWAILLYSLFNGIRALGEYGIGFFSDSVGKAVLMAVSGFGLFGVACLLLALSSDNVVIWIVVFVLAALSTAAVTTLEKSYSAELLPPSVVGTGYGVLHAVTGIGTLLANLILGLMWTSVSASLGFIIAALFCFIAMLLLLRRK